MRKLQQLVNQFVRREDGPTAVEYAVMLALIIVVCIAAITTLGSNASTTFNKVATTIGAGRGASLTHHAKTSALAQTWNLSSTLTRRSG